MLFVNISDIFLSYCQRAIYWVSASSALNRATPHFYPFQFSEIKYLPLGLCAGVWIWPNTLWQRRRVWKKYSRARQRTEIQQPNTFLRVLRTVIWNRDNVSPLEFGWGRFFLIVRVDFFETAPGDAWQGLCRNLRPPLYFPAYPIGIKLLQGSAEKETNSWCSTAQIGKSVGITEFPRIEQDRKLRYQPTHQYIWAGVLLFFLLLKKWHCCPTFSSLKCLPCLRELRGF